MRSRNITIADVKRGDTIIEVMFAFAIFTMVAIVTVSMMNLGLATSERSLELVTARNELNAQAEALRFVHSSYISELTLPSCDDAGSGQKCQQYAKLWQRITENAVNGASEAVDNYSLEYPVTACEKVYDDESLRNHHAFVLNTRKLTPDIGDVSNLENVIVYAKGKDDIDNKFVAPTLNARILYDSPGSAGDSDSTLSTVSFTEYTHIARVEGIWVIAVRGPRTNGSSRPQYYDFYIQTCWYGSNNSAATSLDAVVRLYNPDGIR